MPAFCPADLPRKSSGLFFAEHDGVFHIFLHYDGGAGVGSGDPYGDGVDTQHQLAGYPAAPRSIHFSDSGDPYRPQIGKSAECGGVPAERGIPGYSGNPAGCRAVHRFAAGERLDPVGVWPGLHVARVGAPQNLYGKVYL